MSIQGHALEVTVVGSNRLKDTEWISRQDPYVVLVYAGARFRTRTCTDGDKNPTFQERFVIELIEGLRVMDVEVWNSNTLLPNKFIGSGKILLQKALSEGKDESPWTIQSKDGRYAGEVNLIIKYCNPQAQAARADHGRTSTLPPAATAPPLASASANYTVTYPSPYATTMPAAMMADSYNMPPADHLHPLPRSWSCPYGHMHPAAAPHPPPPAYPSHIYPPSTYHPLVHPPQPYPPNGAYSAYPPPPYY